MAAENREKEIIKTSVVGVIINLLMAVLKALIGLISNSIAIILDAVNNLSDAFSSVVTIIGAKLGAKAPNRKHPLGYGRIEYLSSMIVAAIVIYAGITSLVESVKKIISPETADYNVTTLLILTVAIIVKIFLGQYVKKQGVKYKSGALVASGTEATLDALLSVTVLASALIYILWNISLEAYVGVIIAVLIIKTGIEMLNDTLDDILGKRSDREEVANIKRLICEEPQVRGAYDLILYNYGPNKNYASVHIELPDTMQVSEVDVISRRIQEKVFMNTGVVITGISVYSYNTSNDEASQIRDRVQKIVMENEWALQMHGFFIDMINKKMRFDVVVSFDVEREKEIHNLTQKIEAAYPEYKILISGDIDV